jgi:hypothetical protein
MKHVAPTLFKPIFGGISNEGKSFFGIFGGLSGHLLYFSL